MLKNIFLFCSFFFCFSIYGENPSKYECPDTNDNKKVFWGDLHVHSGYSMDAYAFGTRNNPGEAFEFAQGKGQLLADNKTQVKLERPLDFMAVTDHAETFDVMYLCSDPLYSDFPYCDELRVGSNSSTTSLDVFQRFLLPLISEDKPMRSPLCIDNPDKCDAAAALQWERVQDFANKANDKCNFTAFIGFEWSATPNSHHWHRNIIYASDAVSKEALDYIRYPSVDLLFEALEDQCKLEEGCDVLSIPHNINWSEGGGFEVENIAELTLLRRAKYERLVEMFQSKGGSECLPEHWDQLDSDCNFENAFTSEFSDNGFASGALLENLPQRERQWLRIRSGYARSLLAKGLISYKETSLNPLKLGFIGSTDSHTGTGGRVEENNWKGTVWSWGDNVERRLSRLAFNPGGLVGVWAKENTRSSIFSALKGRETYSTSGPRIGLKIALSDEENNKSCNFNNNKLTIMGGTISKVQSNPTIIVKAYKDKLPLVKVEIIKGALVDNKIVEKVITITEENFKQDQLCLTWNDKEFDKMSPAFWYARVLELSSPRWSKFDCLALNNCETLAVEANQEINERAWSSPIWYLPN